MILKEFNSTNLIEVIMINMYFFYKLLFENSDGFLLFVNNKLFEFYYYGLSL